MRIIEVMPFVKSHLSGTLSYFTSKDVSSGDIVSIPLRGKNVIGLVVKTETASDSKSYLRSSEYSLKKISSVLGESIFSKAFLRTAELISEFYVSSVGEIIFESVPKGILDSYKELKKESGGENSNDGKETKPERFVFQRDSQERLDQYKTLIRTEFAKGSSIFLCLPTKEEISTFSKKLSGGIEKYVYQFHSGLSKKELIKKYNKISEEKHPVLIIGTPHFLFINKVNQKTIILEHESSLAYRTIARPYIDFRVFAETLAVESGQKIIFGDTFLRIETLSRLERGELLEYYPIKWRMQSSHKGLLVDTRKKDGGFKFLSEDAIKIIKETISSKGKVFIYTARRGLSPVTVCSDCGITLVCTKCNSPLVLHGQSNGKRVFICHKCKSEHPSDSPCQNCSGWRMAPLGYGTESVLEELSTVFETSKNVDIKRLDKDSANTPSRARAIVEWFENGKNKILIGTDMALYYLSKEIDTIIVASIDSLFSLPSFRINERVFRTLLSLQNQSKKNFLVQTRIKTKDLFEKALDGDLLNFYRNELIDRKSYNYPPFKRLIKITIEGKKPELDKEVSTIKEMLFSYNPESYSAFISKIKNLYRSHVIIRLAPETWSIQSINQKGSIDKTLLRILKMLSPQTSVRVEPEDLL